MLAPNYVRRKPLVLKLATCFSKKSRSTSRQRLKLRLKGTCRSQLKMPTFDINDISSHSSHSEGKGKYEKIQLKNKRGKIRPNGPQPTQSHPEVIPLISVWTSSMSNFYVSTTSPRYPNVAFFYVDLDIFTTSRVTSFLQM